MQPLTISLEAIQSLPAIPLEFRDSLPETSGIYFLVAPMHPRPLLYIGKTTNFRERWKNHHRIREFQVVASIGIPVNLAWLELITSDEMLCHQEKILIQRFKPPLNNWQSKDPYIVRLEQRLTALEKKVDEKLVEPVALLPPASNEVLSEAEILLYKAFKAFPGSESDFIKQVWGASRYQAGKAELAALKARAEG